MSLADAYDAVGANLPLTYCGEHTDKAYAESDTEEDGTVCGKIEFIDQQPHKETNESVNTLSGRKS